MSDTKPPEVESEELLKAVDANSFEFGTGPLQTARVLKLDADARAALDCNAERLLRALVERVEELREELVRKQEEVRWAHSMGTRWRKQSEARGKDIAALALKLSDWGCALHKAMKLAGVKFRDVEALEDRRNPWGVYPRHLLQFVYKLIGREPEDAAKEFLGEGDEP